MAIMGNDTVYKCLGVRPNSSPAGVRLQRKKRLTASCVAGVRRGGKVKRRAREAWEDRVPSPSRAHFDRPASLLLRPATRDNRKQVSTAAYENVRLRERVNDEFVWEFKRGGRHRNECPVRELPLHLSQFYNQFFVRLIKSTSFSDYSSEKIISIDKIPEFLQAFKHVISKFTTAQSGIWDGLLVTSLREPS